MTTSASARVDAEQWSIVCDAEKSAKDDIADRPRQINELVRRRPAVRVS